MMITLIKKIKHIVRLLVQHGFYKGIPFYFFKSELYKSRIEWSALKWLLQHTSFLKKAIEKMIASIAPTALISKIYAEATNACNADCLMCRRNQMTRPVGIMEYALFETIADQSRELGIRQMRFHNFGEPFLDPQLFHKISYAKRIGIPSTALYTNASLLHTENRSQLLASGLDLLFISLDGASEKTYNQIRRNLNFTKVTDNIQELITLKKQRQATTPYIELSFVPSSTNRHEIVDFQRQWTGLADQVSVSQLHDFGGQGESNVDTNGRVTKIPCYMLWKSLFILWNGDVSICCMDFDGKMIIDNVRHRRLLDIWTSPCFGTVRTRHTRGELDFCKNCLINAIHSVDDQVNALKIWTLP